MKALVLRPLLCAGLAYFAVACNAQEVPRKAEQIRWALKAAPEKYRDSATVKGYTAEGDLQVIRAGSNALICLADDPAKEGVSTACYHRDLEPFMARGRALQAQGKSHGEIRQIRGAEIEEGTLSMPDKATLYVFSGRYDSTAAALTDGYRRYVVYMPFATGESTGLPTQPQEPGGPWLMDAGTHRAHIMISPAQ
jgi:hypothetical protein